MNFRSTGISAYQPSLHSSNWKRSLMTKRTRTKVQRRFSSTWRMVRRFSIQKIQDQYWIWLSIQSTTNLNTSVLMKQSDCWTRVLLANHQITVIQATRIQFQACPERSIWRTRFGPCGSLKGDRFGMLICQEHWWWMKWVLEWLSPRLQQQCFANWWLRKLSWGCHYPFYGGIPLRGGWFWRTMTFLALLVKKGSGIRSRDWILCPVANCRSSQHHPTGNQYWSQHSNQSSWSQCL